MPRLDLDNGGWISIWSDTLTIAIGWEGGETAVELSGLDELDDVIHMLAHNELPESKQESETDGTDQGEANG